MADKLISFSVLFAVLGAILGFILGTLLLGTNVFAGTGLALPELGLFLGFLAGGFKDKFNL